MTLHDDLLEQAFHLARREKGEPKQASLRRAVSAAYYALFHLLTMDGALLLSPINPPALKYRIARAFDHGHMKSVCKALSGKNPPEMAKALMDFPLDGDLIAVLKIFIDLQEARHEADYDLGKQWSKTDALAKVEDAQSAFEKWNNIRKSLNASIFLVLMLLKDRHRN